MGFCSRLTFVLLTLSGLAGCAVTGKPDDGFKPMKGQVGKDVMWLPTPQDMVDKLLTVAEVTPQDIVYDLGAGDGVISITAAKRFGARSVGL